MHHPVGLRQGDLGARFLVARGSKNGGKEWIRQLGERGKKEQEKPNTQHALCMCAWPPIGEAKGPKCKF